MTNETGSRDQLRSAVTAWLVEMEACVRAVDFDRCHAIFADDVVGFGSREPMMVGLEALERDQWRHVWPSIRDFTFQIDEMRCSGDPHSIWVACPWTSKRADAPDGQAARPGRMTAVLEQRQGRWVAVHTHHSLDP